MRHIRQLAKKPDGQVIILALVFGTICVLLLTAFAQWFSVNIRASRQAYEREQAMQIAESGIEYYRWHLAHAPLDFEDGTGAAGPYIHIFEDKDGNPIGTFTLTIQPPALGSTLVTVSSSGTVQGGSAAPRAASVRFAKPSIAKYAVAANDSMRFGEGTEVFGPIHSNQGIRFDGIAHNLVTSAVSSYDDPDHSGGNEFGVHTHAGQTDPLPPASPPSRPDVFMAGRQFPVPAIDFAGITADLAQMKDDATTNGFYRPSAGAQGYHIVLKTDDTFDLYRATNIVNAPSGCTNSLNQTGWGTWSIQNEQLIGTYPFPANGIIFLEDDVYVDGQINGGRLTIVAAFLPDNANQRKNIIVNHDLLYTNYDGSDTLGLIAQGNIHVGLVSDDDLRIDAALIAQNGRIGRYYYRPPSGGSQRCSPYHVRTLITLWGMLASNQRYGFAYTDGTGYATRNLTYDGSLLFAPPPNFPLTSDQYVTLSWDEI